MRLPPFRRIALWAGPLAALALALGADLRPDNPATTHTAAVALWMAIWWITGAVHLAVTALLPVVLFPLLKIMPASIVAGLYINDIIFLFLGGFIVALAMERWDLHRRLALRIITVLGGTPRRILLGFMLATAFLSMWISNTATTMMMVPIALGAIARLEPEVESNQGSASFAVPLLLGIAYAASIGGMATLVGTPPNLVFAQIYALNLPDAPPISFTSWLVMALPLSALFLVLTWAGLSYWLGRRGAQIVVQPKYFAKELAELGPMSREERWVLIHFAALALLWLTRGDLVFDAFTLPGWASLLGLQDHVRDGTVAIGVAGVLFLVPSARSASGRLMDWETAKRLPWHIILLFGGGFALARGFADSGLAAWVGELLSGLTELAPWLMVAGICLAVTFLTEFTSNTATTQVILPVLAAVAVGSGVEPLLLMVPATLSASCAFMMPVATPPNAIVFGTGRLQIAQMARVGLVLNLVGVGLITAAIFLLGGALLP